ncbi:MAG: sugar phosphate isomerase/epimerase [Bacteroidota bacterium]
MNSRRTFIKQTGLLVTSLALAPSLAFTTKAPKHPLGLQLWTLRDLLPKDVKGTIAKVADAGYNQVETFGYSLKDKFWGLDAKAFNNLLKQNGLTAPSGHYDMDGFISGQNNTALKSYIEAANILGSEYVTVPYLGDQLRKTADDFKKIAAKLNEAGEICKSAGIKLAYHNHNFEFKKFGNTTGFEILLNETEKNLVDFEMDIYWVVRAGSDPLQLFKAHPNRFKLWHVKDMDKVNKDWNAEVGKGSINFKPIFAAAKQAGVKYYFIEHESNYKPDELGSIKTSCTYVKNELFK